MFKLSNKTKHGKECFFLWEQEQELCINIKLNDLDI